MKRAWKPVLLIASVAASLCWATAAFAISAPIHIHGTGSDGVYLRSTPDQSGTRLRWMAEGTSPDYNCFTYGQSINGVNVWFNVNYSGATGYYASYYDDSSFHSEAELTSKYGIPKCGAAAPTPSPAPIPQPAPTTTSTSTTPTQPPAAPSVTASVGGQSGCGSCRSLDVALHNFPTGKQTYACHDNSGPGGSDVVFYSGTVTVTSAEQSSWPGSFCNDSAPYSAYIVIAGVRSNTVQFTSSATQTGSTPTGSTGSAGGGGSSSPPGSGADPNSDQDTGSSDTGGDGAVGPAPGPAASPASLPAPATPAAAPTGGAVYFSPYGSKPEGHPFGYIKTTKTVRQNWDFYPAPAAAQTISADQWNPRGGGCPTAAQLLADLGGGSNTTNSTGTFGGRQVTTLGSWSATRALPFKLLEFQPTTSGYVTPWLAKVNYILLFDPEGEVQFNSRNCLRGDALPVAVARFLSDPSHRLVVLSGKDTFDEGNVSQDGHGHAGIQDGLFAKLKTSANSGSRQRAIVCDYKGMAHWKVWANFRSYLTAAPITKSTCPRDPRAGKTVTSWNP